ncbi:NUDIX hydrolase [Lishizhenia sp.]|uniref:NUDIX hydrolase n=1 Tax=Lishizhenia sp. TaxID=2497594 RepID=UPI00299D2E2E|nr:NUDIX domain-containing protein [Lishizhenia sp.]MDX1446078.1 NUDIX domain-containing protein [Lishizhenia sp.]
MYKVFIENTPLYFVKNEKGLKSDTFLIKGKLNEIVLKNILSTYRNASSKIRIAIVDDEPKKAMRKLFENYAWVEAAGGIVRDTKHDKYLFIKRNGFWDIAKGKLKKGEDTILGAQREIEEECGISNISYEDEIIETYHIYDTYGKDVIKKTYWYSFTYDGDEKLTPQIEEGITKVKWFSKPNLDKIRYNTFASIVEVMDAYKHFKQS